MILSLSTVITYSILLDFAVGVLQPQSTPIPAVRSFRIQEDVSGQYAFVMPGGLADSARAVRIMVAGDSMSHGQEGDYTWRYRLWQWLRQEQVNFEFVGPCYGTKRPDESRPPSPPPVEPPVEEAPDPCASDGGGYAQGLHFGSCHLSRWGKQAVEGVEEVKAQVARFRPDILLVFLGFNDLAWGVSGPETLIEVIRKLMGNSRAASSTLRFAIANIPQRGPTQETERLAEMVDMFNERIQPSISDWDTEQSPVKLVKVREVYDCVAGSYDGIHPNALGEFQIAKAFSKVLISEFGIGTEELVIPKQIPERLTPMPENVVAKAVSYGIAVTWDHVYGARGYDLRSRTGDGSSWDQWRKSTNRHDTVCAQDGLEYQYQVRTFNGQASGKDITSEWSPLVAAVASPKVAPAPTNVFIVPGVSDVALQWHWPHRQWKVVLYEVQVTNKSTSLAFPIVQGVKGNIISFPNSELISGHRYAVFVRAWTQEGPGTLAAGRSFIAGHGMPSEPANLQVETTDPVTVKLTWDTSEYASGYRVWVRKSGEDSNFEVDGETEHAEHGVTFLVPGAWSFEFCVSALNGDLESSRSSSVIPPRPEPEL